MGSMNTGWADPETPVEGARPEPTTVEGYFWHTECVYGAPGRIRSDDGGFPEKGDFIQRAITMGEARRLGKTDSDRPACHPCLRTSSTKKHWLDGQTQDDYIVLSYKLTADLCICDTDHHKGERKLAFYIWRDAPAMEGEEGAKVMAEKLICGDCWYKDNSMPPDTRRTLPDPINCMVCNDPTVEVVVIPVKASRTQHEEVPHSSVDVEDGEYIIVVEWERMAERKEYYKFVIGDPDMDDLAMVRDNDFHDAAWEVADDNSDAHHMEDYEEWGISDEGPSEIRFTVREK